MINIKSGVYIYYETLDFRNSVVNSRNDNIVVIQKYNKMVSEIFNITKKQMDERFHDNDKCFVFMGAGAPIGMMWGHVGSCYIRGVGLSMLLDTDVLYWYWILILPSVRGKGIFKQLRDYYFFYYKSRNIYKCCALVDSRNDIMKYEMNKLRFIEIYRVAYLKISAASFIMKKELLRSKVSITLEVGNRHKLSEI
jgi:GNAT superfamily N-acetyltransferase